MLRTADITLTFASGHEFLKDPCFWVYIKSFLQNVKSDLVIFTHEMSSEVENQLLQMGVFEVVRVPNNEAGFLYRDRHLSYWRYLSQHPYRYVMSTDCRDVVFQRCPFAWLSEKQRGDHFVIMAAEGHKMSQSGFACIEHFEFERDVPLPYLQKDRERFIVNGGTFIGTAAAMQNWHFMVWMTTMKTIGRCTDQATVNWLLYYLDSDPTYEISYPQYDAFCLTGEGVKEGAVEPILKNGLLYTADDQMYSMIHQWDRLSDLREEILSRFND